MLSLIQVPMLLIVHNISLSLVCHQGAGSVIGLPFVHVHQNIDLGHEAPELGADDRLINTDSAGCSTYIHSEAMTDTPKTNKPYAALETLLWCKHFICDGLF